jgi:hypothetical protein
MRTFPILVSFDGKPPLVVGGGELAAVKARLLLKRAASVDVAASGVVPELAALAEQKLVSLIPARPGIDQLRGRPLVIAATEDEEEDTRVSAIARALGVPVNVPTGRSFAPSRFRRSSIAARSRLPSAPQVPHQCSLSACAPGSSRSFTRASMRLPNSQRSSAGPSPTGCHQVRRAGSSGRPCSKAPPPRRCSKAMRTRRER